LQSSSSSNNTQFEKPKPYTPSNGNGLVNKAASAFNNGTKSNNNEMSNTNGNHNPQAINNVSPFPPQTKIEPPASPNPPAPYESTSNVPLYAPPVFLQPKHGNEDEDDEWGDNSEIKIEPTIAPLATYDEETTSMTPPGNHDNHFESYEQTTTAKNNNGYHNQSNNEENNITKNTNGNGTTAVNNNLVAVALYDYQAADNDEISFDPNDIITDIVQVKVIRFSLKYYI
jgi:hypothetical protein